MRARLYKEVRLLLPPLGAVVGAMLLGAWLLATRGQFRGQAQLGRQLAEMALFLGIPVIAATPFGAEFHYRTMTLLLAQPVARARLWLEKWLTLIAVVLLVFALELAAERFVPRWQPREFALPLYAGILVCSAPLWTLVSRSTIGGLAFAGTAMMMVELAMTYVHFRLTGTHLKREVFGNLPAFHAVRAIYAAATLAAGWWLFQRFEPTAAGFGDRTAAQGASGTVLRPRPRGVVANLVRKELMLQRITFLVAAGFTVCWLVAVAIVAAQQRPSGFSEVVFPLLLGIHVPVVTALAGAMSNGEDRSLGVHGWHLAQPVSSTLQWEVKLVVSLVVGVLLAVVLPATLSRLTDALLPNGHVMPVTATWRFVELAACGVTLCFWASSLFGHTVRGVVGTGALLFAWAIGTTVMAMPLGDLVGRRLHLTVTDLGLSAASFSTVFEALVTLFVLLALLPAIFQSLRAFRRVQMGTAMIVRSALVVLAVAWTLTFFIAVLSEVRFV